jgi:D-glycero-beta-D-manno-heptose 1-phosphate adenylyltransferase
MGLVLTQRDLAVALERERAAGRRIVLTNGCFDLIHVGHVRSLRAARALGDVLVVGLNSDASVRAIKGPDRPLVPESDRAEVIASLEPVDYVVLFDEPTAERLASTVRPAVYAKGGDYAAGAGIDESRLPEARVVAQLGGRTELIPLVAGRSTTAIVEKIRRGIDPA